MVRQKHWGWPIPAYLYLAGMGAGAYTIGVVMSWMGFADAPPKWLLLWGPLLVTLGAPFLIIDLGQKLRFLSAARNPRTSWMSRGFAILTSCILLGLANFALAVLWDLLPWLAQHTSVSLIMPGWLSSGSAFVLALQAAGLLAAVGTALYTGIFLQSVRYISLWHTPLLPLLFLVSALSTGSMLTILSVIGYSAVGGAVFPEHLVETITRLEQVFVVIEAVVLLAYLLLRYRSDIAVRSSVRLMVSGSLRFVFWAGIVACGFVFPVVLEGIYTQLPDYRVLLFLSGLSLLIGGFFLRYAIVSAGIKERHPLERMVGVKFGFTPPLKSNQ